jgi:hypothetical protein
VGPGQDGGDDGELRGELVAVPAGAGQLGEPVVRLLVERAQGPGSVEQGGAGTVDVVRRTRSRLGQRPGPQRGRQRWAYARDEVDLAFGEGLTAALAEHVEHAPDAVTEPEHRA